MSAFIDTNVVIYASDESAPLHDWALERIGECKVDGAAFVCDIVYCELSIGFRNKTELNRVINALELQRVPHSDDALIGAGEAYLTYKRAHPGVPKLGVLPDFLIGSTAMAADLPLVTANGRDFIKHFPDLQIIRP